MYPIEKITLKTFSKILHLLLHFVSITGLGFFSSCNVKYGSPSTKYEVPVNSFIHFKGKVMSADSLKPIQGINVKLSSSSKDTLLNTSTTSTGFYTITQNVNVSENLKLIFSDIDGNINGDFFSKEISTCISYGDIIKQYHETNVYLQRKPKL